MTIRRALLLSLAIGAAGCGDDATFESEPAPPGTTLWGRRFGKTTHLDAIGLAGDASGNVVVGGRFFASADFGQGPVQSPANNWQAFVAKYAPDGAALWVKSLGDIYEERVNRVGVDAAGNVYLAGEFRGTIDFGGGPLQSQGGGSDIFLAKLAPDGAHLWSKRFGGEGYELFDAMEVEPGGSIALLGSAADGTDFGSGPIAFGGSPFIAKFDPSGAPVFVVPYSTTPENYSYPTALAYSAEALVVTADAYDEFGNSRATIASIGPNGDKIWEREFDQSGGGAVTAIALGEGGRIYLGGPLGYSVDLGNGVVAVDERGLGGAFVAQLAADGAPLWIRAFSPKTTPQGPDGTEIGGMITVGALGTTSGGVVLTGAFFGSVDFGSGVHVSGMASEPPTDGYYYGQTLNDVFAVRFDDAGNHQWDVWYGNHGSQQGSAVGTDGAGNIFLGGSSNGPMLFAPGEFNQTEYFQGFVVKLAH